MQLILKRREIKLYFLEEVVPTSNIWNSSVRKMYPTLPPLCLFINHLFILKQSHHRYLFYSLGSNPVLSLFIILLRLFQLWPLEALSVGSYVLFRCPFLFFFFFKLPYFWAYMMLQAHLMFSLSQYQSQPFLQGGLVPVIGKGIQKPRSGCWLFSLFIIF